MPVRSRRERVSRAMCLTHGGVRRSNSTSFRMGRRLREGMPVQADGSIPLIARAWAVRGTVPK